MKDDRYRIAQTVEGIGDALWHAAQDYGTAIATDEQVAIARTLRVTLERRAGPLTRRDVHAAFERFEVRLPRRGFARDVIERLERLDTRKPEAVDAPAT